MNHKERVKQHVGERLLPAGKICLKGFLEELVFGGNG